MNDAPQTLRTIFTSRLILIAFLLVPVVMAGWTAVLFQAPELLGREKSLTDFDAFYIAGDLALQDRAGDAYRAVKMLVAQQEVSSRPSFMPWTYPPVFTLVVEALAHLPIGAAYLAFVLITFAFYVHILWRIAGRFLPGVFIAILPLVPLIVRTGQNGFLTGGLIGWFLLAFMERRRSAGIPMGLMIIKPHLAAGIALLSLLERRWATMAIAASVVIAALGLATFVYGVGIWPAFFGGVREAGNFLSAGFYPMFRMTSVYAWVRTFDVPAPVALAVHLAVAALAVGWFLWVWWRSKSPQVVAAAVCTVSLFISPYNYDYDLAILGVAIAFLLPVLVERARPMEITGLVALTWVVTGYGLVINMLHEGENDSLTNLGELNYLSLIAPVFIGLVYAVYRVLRRMECGSVRDGKSAG